MSKLLSAIPLLATAAWALAAGMDDAANAPLAEGVPLVYVWLFLGGFAALIVGFFAYMWWLERKKKSDR